MQTELPESTKARINAEVDKIIADRRYPPNSESMKRFMVEARETEATSAQVLVEAISRVLEEHPLLTATERH